NNIGVAALMLPVVVDVARRTRIPQSVLLMPLAFATLLGGQTTLFTSHNLLVSEALARSGNEPFGVFDFTPVGGAIAVAGVLFIAFIGRLLLPKKSRTERGRYRSQRSLRARYKLQEQTFMMRVPVD